MQAKTVRTSGFTLIELLVVIAIIAILAAILFPVFTAARQKAKQAECIQRLRDIGTAFSLYTSDWSGTMPNGTNEPMNNLIRKPLQQQLSLYIKVRKNHKGVVNVDADGNPIMGDTGVPIVFFCPSFPETWRTHPWYFGAGTFHTVAYDRIADDQFPAKKLEYCIDLWNQWVAQGKTGTRVNPPRAGASGAQLMYCSFGSQLPAPAGSDKYYYPHSSGSNCLYLDWHVKWNKDKSAVDY